MQKRTEANKSLRLSSKNTSLILPSEDISADNSIISSYTSRSPLRYPGGKTRAIDYITSFFPKDIKQLISPFLGGGSIELTTAANNITVYAYDAFSPLVEFWQCLLEQPHNLANEVEKYFPLPKEDFYTLQQTQTAFTTKLQRAAVYYVLNRSSFSGSTLSGGMSPEHPRFTQTAIQRLRDFHNPNIIVKQADFKISLEEHASVFAYLDPPYLIKSKLYGKNGNAHKNFDHEGLAALLRKRDGWILSYNDCDEIRSLYEGFYLLVPNWKYGMSNDKASKEVLIFSKDFDAKRCSFG